MKMIFLLLLCLFSTACTTLSRQEYDVNKHEYAKGDPALQTVGDHILHAIQTDNYEEFSRYVKENEISGEEFQNSRKNIMEQFGTITGYEYLTDLEIPLLHNMIWKVNFERKGNNQKSVKQELLFRLVLGTINGKNYVVSMSFL